MTNSSAFPFVGTRFEPWMGLQTCNSTEYCAKFLHNNFDMGGCLEFSGANGIPDGTWCSCSVVFARFGEDCGSVGMEAILSAFLQSVPLVLASYGLFRSLNTLIDTTAHTRATSLILFLTSISFSTQVVWAATRVLMLFGLLHDRSINRTIIGVAAGTTVLQLEVCTYFWLLLCFSPGRRKEVKRRMFIYVACSSSGFALVNTILLMLKKSNLAAALSMVFLLKCFFQSLGIGLMLRRKLKLISSSTNRPEKLRGVETSVVHLQRNIMISVSFFTLSSVLFLLFNPNPKVRSFALTALGVLGLTGMQSASILISLFVLGYASGRGGASHSSRVANSSSKPTLIATI